MENNNVFSEYAIIKLLTAHGGRLIEWELFDKSGVPRKQYERERTELIMAKIIRPCDINGKNGLEIIPEGERKNAGNSKSSKDSNRHQRRGNFSGIDDEKEITTINPRTYGYFNDVMAWADRLADYYGDVSIDEGQSGTIWTVEGVETGKIYRYRVTVDEDGGITAEKAGRRR